MGEVLAGASIDRSPIHIHANSLGVPGNYEVTLETLKSVEDLASNLRPAMHLCYVQFNAFAGKGWTTLSSGAAKLDRSISLCKVCYESKL